MVRRAADRLRRHRARRLAAGGRPRRRGSRGHALRLGRLADEGEPVVHLRAGAERADRPLAAGDSPRARLLRAGGRVRRHQRPLGHPGRRARRARRDPGAAYRPRAARHARDAARIRLDRRGRAPRRADLDLREPAPADARSALGGDDPERDRPLDLPVEAAQGRLPALPRPLQPRQGSAPSDRCRDGARFAPEDGRQEPGAEGAAVLRRARRAAPRPRRDRVPRRGDARREGRAAPGRAGDALPDRVGGAVRPGDDRVDGLRHAGDRDPPRRRARGDRARA